MIELCDIFSLDSPAKQQVLFVRQPFNLSSNRAISVLRYFMVHVRIRSHSFQLKLTVCFERLIESLNSVFANACQNPIN